ncbi:hypothetical protein OPKNFCMD_5767 [Methylobacterium crusticola]|uniref:Uncharacterized protein n=2 Tax=Methylobacterium crusticola TaxID=1697972 RepID=A0ABQ4R6E5_9HYPH|nr:hypothetical protein OPKNFCMD_5767 [Methylobacterium crusticola]
MIDTQDSRRTLWREVIHQALADAVSTNRELADERELARAWFRHATRDFREVCALADLEPDCVRIAALKCVADHDAGKPTFNLHRVLQHAGRALTINEWAECSGIASSTLRYRLRLGWTAEATLTTPLRSAPDRPPAASRRPLPRGRHEGAGPAPKTLTFQGETLTVAEWARRLGLTRAGLYLRLASMPVEAALATPVQRRGARGKPKAATAQV